LYGLRRLNSRRRTAYETRERNFLESPVDEDVEAELMDSIFSIACPLESNPRFISYAFVSALLLGL